MNVQVIEKAIAKNGLKKNWVAEQIGVHPGTLRRFLRGKADLSSAKLIRLLEILDLKLEALVKSA